MDVIDQVLQIFAGSKGLLDDIALSDVPQFASELIQHLQGASANVREELESGEGLSDELEAKLVAAMENFKKTTSFAATNSDD